MERSTTSLEPLLAGRLFIASSLPIGAMEDPAMATLPLLPMDSDAAMAVRDWLARWSGPIGALLIVVWAGAVVVAFRSGIPRLALVLIALPLYPMGFRILMTEHPHDYPPGRYPIRAGLALGVLFLLGGLEILVLGTAILVIRHVLWARNSRAIVVSFAAPTWTEDGLRMEMHRKDMMTEDHRLASLFWSSVVVTIWAVGRWVVFGGPGFWSSLWSLVASAWIFSLGHGIAYLLHAPWRLQRLTERRLRGAVQMSPNAVEAKLARIRQLAAEISAINNELGLPATAPWDEATTRRDIAAMTLDNRNDQGLIDHELQTRLRELEGAKKRLSDIQTKVEALDDVYKKTRKAVRSSGSLILIDELDEIAAIVNENAVGRFVAAGRFEDAREMLRNLDDEFRRLTQEAHDVAAGRGHTRTTGTGSGPWNGDALHSLRGDEAIGAAYFILGLDQDAPFTEAKKKHRLLARRLHPDAMGSDGDTHEEMTRLNWAIDTLKSLA